MLFLYITYIGSIRLLDLFFAEMHPIKDCLDSHCSQQMTCIYIYIYIYIYVKNKNNICNIAKIVGLKTYETTQKL